MNSERIQAFENKFNDYSDRAHSLVFLLRSDFMEQKSYGDVLEMRENLVECANEMLSLDQEYKELTGKQDSHPNYEKFTAYAKLAHRGLDQELDSIPPQFDYLSEDNA